MISLFVKNATVQQNVKVAVLVMYWLWMPKVVWFAHRFLDALIVPPWLLAMSAKLDIILILGIVKCVQMAAVPAIVPQFAIAADHLLYLIPTIVFFATI